MTDNDFEALGTPELLERAADILDELDRRGIDPITFPCTAKIHHGPGHQSSTSCRVRGPHAVHEAVYGGDTFARWHDGQYRDQLVAQGIEVPSWVDEGTAMTGFFDEPPQDDE